MNTQSSIIHPDIYKIHSDLENAIKIPKSNRQDNWEAETSKLVALSNVDYHHQTNDALAIKTIVLIKLAAKAKVKSAGNLKLALTRWTREAPVALSEILKDEDEKIVAVKELKSLKAPWVIDYVVSELQVCKYEPLAKELIDWALKNSGHFKEFITAFNQQYIGGHADIVTLNLMLKSVLKNTLFDDKVSLEHPFQEIQAAIEAIGDDSLKNKANSKLVSELQILVVQYLDTITSINPGFLVLASTANLIFCIASLSKSLPKVVEKKITFINKRLFNNIHWLLPHLDQQNSTAILGSLDLYKKSFPLFDKQFKSIFGKDFASFKLVTDDNSRQQNTHMLEESLLSFMPSWYSFISKNKNNPEIEQLDNKISKILKVSNIKFQDSVNDFVDFNPLKHELIDKSSRAQTKVRVLTPGLVATGQNNAERVLLKSIVSTD